MIMSNALIGLASVASLVNPNNTADGKATAAGKAAMASPALLPTQTAAMRDVVSHYDMTEITPNDFSKLIQQLSDKGAISQKDTQELSSIRVDMENAGINSDDSVNLLQFYQERVAKAQAAAAQSPNSAAAKSNVDALAGRLTWVQKFAAMGQQGSASGVNAVA
jgi:hypothetical protein